MPDGSTLDLDGHKITVNNFSFIFVGNDIAITNGSFVTDGSYALWLGDEDTSDGITVENVTVVGGINVYNASNVVLRNVTAVGHTYYAVWADEDANVTIKSGNYSTEGKIALLGTCQENINITGGNFVTNGLPLAIISNGDTTATLVISGGTFDTDVTKYLGENQNIEENTNGTYSVTTVYEVTAGEEQKITTSTDTDITITIDADYELFDELYINGKLVDKKYYTVKSGSTIITLTSEYAKTLEAGDYEVTATFTNGGTATTSLTLVADETTTSNVTTTNPDTADNMLTYFVVAIISVIGLMLTTLHITKKAK